MKQIKLLIKSILGLKKSQTLDSRTIIKQYDKKIRNKFYKKKYNTKDIVEKLKELGVNKGDNILVHSSWDAFNNYKGTPKELIDALLDLIGPEGTIAMPAYPLIRKKLFDVRNSVTKAGILSETFRHYPNVKRSANVSHSVCALGPKAVYLTKDHNLSKIRFDEFSPYYRACLLDFKIISLGLPTYFMGTICHCVEATMWKEIPYFKSFFNYNDLIEQHYIGEDGVEHSYKEYKEVVHVRNDYFRNQYIYWRYFDKKHRSRSHISNLRIGRFDSKYGYERLCELAKKGIVLYITPKFYK